MISPETRAKYRVTIGIECHVQLKTETKLFSSVGNDAREAEPNTLVSHICFGLPGALPVLNQEAIHLAKLSLHKNYMHASTHRSLTIAQVMAGHLPEARISAKNLMQISPHLTVTNYLARITGSQYGVGKAFADALHMAGVPA